MEYKTLTNTSFFRNIDLKTETDDTEMETAYHDFVTKVIELCCSDGHERHMILLFTETELQHHRNRHGHYVKKALTFIRQIQKHLPAINIFDTGKQDERHVPADKVPLLKWTGNAVDLVEMFYGISVMGCINNGKTPIRDIAALLYNFFGITAKDCYRFYIDIRRRKNDDRTYFLNTMCERLNDKMREDDRKELDRK